MRLLSTFCSYFFTSSNHAPSTGTPFRRQYSSQTSPKGRVFSSSTSREQLIPTIENYIDYYNNRRYQHRLFIQTPMQAHVSAMNRVA